MRVLSASLTDQVPKLAPNPRAACSNSSTVADARRLLVPLNLGGQGPRSRSVSPTGIEDEDAFRIGTGKVMPLGTVRGRYLVRDERPCAYELVLEYLLLGDGAAWQQGQAERRDHRKTESVTSIYSGFLRGYLKEFGARADTAGVQNAVAAGTRDNEPKTDFQIEIVPTDGTSAANGGAETSVRRRFLGSALDKLRLVHICSCGASNARHNRRREISIPPFLPSRCPPTRFYRTECEVDRMTASGPKRTCRDVCYLAAFGGKADIAERPRAQSERRRELRAWGALKKCDGACRSGAAAADLSKTATI